MSPRRPVRVTLTIAAATVLAYILALVAGGPHLILQAGFVPARWFMPLPFDAVPFWATPLTATLLHGGLAHIGLNLVMLVFCGRQVEGVLGGYRLLILYVLGAYGAALGQLVAEPGSVAPMIGASGAISAVVAAYAMMFSRSDVRAIGPVPGILVRAVWLAIAWTGIQLALGVATGGSAYAIAIAAHIGGFIAGLVLVQPLLEWRYRSA